MWSTCLCPDRQLFDVTLNYTRSLQLFNWGFKIAGAHNSTAEVEHELMDLWNAVEKDRVVQAARRSVAARNRTHVDPGQPPLKKV